MASETETSKPTSIVDGSFTQAGGSPPNDGSEPRKTRPHLPFLDGIRALAALYVVVHHAAINNLRLPGARPLSQVLLYGNYAVDVFIVLSGFSLMLPVAIFGDLKGGGRSFLRRRARRIVPPFLFAILFSVILGATVISTQTGTTWDSSVPVTAQNILAHVTFTHDLFKSQAHKLNYPLWSVSVEMHIYLLFPLVVLAFTRYRGWRITVAAVALGYAFQLLLAKTRIDSDPNGVCPYYLGLFVLGCLASRLAVNHADRVRWYPLAVVGGTVIATEAASWLWTAVFHQGLPAQASSLFVGIFTAAALLALASGQWRAVRHALSWRPIAFIGTFAYSIYLVHAPILQLVWQYLVHPMRLTSQKESFALIFIATPLVVVLSWLFSLAFEKPFIPRSPAAERLAAP